MLTLGWNTPCHPKKVVQWSRPRYKDTFEKRAWKCNQQKAFVYIQVFWFWHNARCGRGGEWNGRRVCDSGHRTYVTDVMIGLKERFANKVGSVLKSLDVFHIESLPYTREKWVQCFDEYGYKKLDILIKHYSVKKSQVVSQTKQCIISGECLAQWRLVRQIMFEAHMVWSPHEKQGIKIARSYKKWNTWITMNANQVTLMSFGWISSRNHEILQFSFQTSEDWWNYSWLLYCLLYTVNLQMNLTKTLQRTRILTDLLRDLITIKLNAIDFGKESTVLKRLIDRAYDMWVSRKPRCKKWSRIGLRDNWKQKKWFKTELCGIFLDKSEEQSSWRNTTVWLIW